MKRRLLAALAAIVLLVAGTAILIGYVQGADRRALAGVQTVEVLVVTEQIPAGTPAGELADSVGSELVPAKAALPGRVTDLTALADQVATVDLLPGEQLLADRFAAPDDLQAAGTIAVPEGLQEVSVLLEPQRAIGGRLAAGDEVAVYVSILFQDGTANTHAVLHGVLVTQVQGAPTPAEPAEGDPQTASSGAPLPSGSLMVTLALTARQAEPVVFGMEHGTVWLGLEPEGADTSGTDVITQGNVYEKSYQ